MIMKTTDGKELKKGGYYYSREGNKLLLQDWGQGTTAPFYLVSRIYEDEVMETHLYPTGHTEITIPFEFECDPTFVHEIFKDAHVFIVEEQYQKKLDELEALSISIGETIKSKLQLSKRIVELEATVESLISSITEREEELEVLTQTKEETQNVLSNLQEEVKKVSQILNETPAGDTIQVGVEKLNELYDRDFKLNCLEAGGVDNWEWYDESLSEYFKAGDK